MKKVIGKILTRIPFLRYAYLYKHNSSFRPGHYYSPVADVDDLEERQDAIWAPKPLPGIDLNEAGQKEFMAFLFKNELLLNIPWKAGPAIRYYEGKPILPLC